MSADEPEQKPSSIKGYYSEVGSELCLLSIKRGEGDERKSPFEQKDNNFLIKKAPAGAFHRTGNKLADIFQAAHIRT
ncbi:hypothetical protein [Serratia liquefaciens]|uniref:hypothetical protein n=1 Tax=Serratia liquefaciens TaxID=614 RepID=UPI00384EB26E